MSDSSDAIFGDWVYCSQHLAAHKTGWCTVDNSDKLGLGAFSGTFDEQFAAATEKCRAFRLPLYNDPNSNRPVRR